MFLDSFSYFLFSVFQLIMWFNEFMCTIEALHGMEAVAEHINEMQKIYEEYGSTFDELAKQYRDVYPHSKVL